MTQNKLKGRLLEVWVFSANHILNKVLKYVKAHDYRFSSKHAFPLNKERTTDKLNNKHERN